jgi:hypothetical protein
MVWLFASPELIPHNCAVQQITQPLRRSDLALIRAKLPGPMKQSFALSPATTCLSVQRHLGLLREKHQVVDNLPELTIVMDNMRYSYRP